MYKKQVHLFQWDYMINDNENEAEKDNTSHKYDINRHRARYGPEYSKCKTSLNIMMVICTKQHLSNI